MSDENFPTQSQGLQAFLARHRERPELRDRFALENPSVLELNLKQSPVYAKAGSMIAFTGPLRFRREGFLERGLMHIIKRLFTSEGAVLMKVEGDGRAYLADKAKRIQILRLENESITVNGNDLLAFDGAIKFEIRLLRRLGAMLAGGLFNVELSGTGYVAVCTHGHPIVLEVGHNRPVYTDPQATVAWPSHLQPGLSTRFELGALWGRSSGETVRMQFEGDGWVLVQPYEERPVTSNQR